MSGRRSKTPSTLDIEATDWFFENGLDAFIVTQYGRVVRTNPAWTAISGWSAEEMHGRAAREFIAEQDLPIFEEAVRELNIVGHGQLEHRIRAKSGELIWIRSRTKRVAEGGGLIVIEEISEERARKAEAENAERSSELLRDAAGIITWRFDPDRNLYDISSDISQPIGDGAAETLHSREVVLALCHREDQPRLTEAFERTIRTGEFVSVDYRQRRAKGEWSRCRASWRGIRPTASGRWQLIGITQDVTELAEARDAAERNEAAAMAAGEAKAQFLANMSHEIRTPMNGVLGVLHLLADEPLSDEGRRLLKEALACGAMLAELLNDVIDFSKIEAGRLELAPAPVHAAEALEGVASLLRPQAESRDLSLATIVAPDVGWVSVDPVRLRQMLFNLIGNAVKFTLSGGVVARMSACGAGAERRLRVEVEDTGIGMSQAVQATLFERFHQADASTTRRFGGSGLGLAITRRLVDMMDGEIGVESREGEGSTFWFEIAAPTAQPVAVGAAAAGDWLDGVRVLVVEDNATNRLIATKLLERLGAQVETAEDGAAGVAAAQRSAFDLILMDVQMPVMDGVEATRAIRKLEGAAGATPILAMSANVLAHQQKTYLECGMGGAVAKPLSPAALLAEIGRISTRQPVAGAPAKVA